MHKIAKIVKKEDVRPALCGVLFKGNKIVATDSFKLLEITGEDQGLNLIVPGRYFKAGDTMTAEGQIKRKDGAIVHPAGAIVNEDSYPMYEQLMPIDEDLDEQYESIRLTRDHLVDLIDAMPDQQIQLFVPKANRAKGKYRPVFVRTINKKVRGLLMPVQE